MSQCPISQIVEAVRAIETVNQFNQSKFGVDVTFFTKQDQWQYIAVMDDRTCGPCLTLELLTFVGNDLVHLFPYLDVVDTDTILAYIHPNCRCYLRRVIMVKEQ